METNTSFEQLLNTPQKKLDFFQNTVLVAIADGYVDEMESDFLVMIGEQLGLSEEDTRPIADNLASLTFTIPEDGLQRLLELQTLVMLVLQDGEVEKREYNLCLEYTRQIGYSQDTLDYLLARLGARLN